MHLRCTQHLPPSAHYNCLAPVQPVLFWMCAAAIIHHTHKRKQCSSAI